MTALHESFTNTHNSYWFLYLPWEIWIPFYTDSTPRAWRFEWSSQKITTTSKYICTLLFTISCIRDGTLMYYMQQFHRNSIWLHIGVSSHYPQRHISTLFQENFWCWQSFFVHKLKAHNPFLSSVFNNNEN